MLIFRRTTLIAVFSLSILVGLGLARRIGFVPTTSLLLIAPAALLLRFKNLASFIVVLTLGLAIGLWRGNIYMQNLNNLKTLTMQKVTIETTAKTDSVYAKKSQVEFTANKTVLVSPHFQKLAGSFKISGFGVPMVYRGDRIRVSGKLFPMRGSNQARIAYAKIEKIGSGDSLIYDLTRKFNAGMQNALPEPQASFGLGLLIGQRSTLPISVTEALTAVGLVHIVAVSGYNLTILVQAAGRLKLKSKYQKLVISLTLISGFVLITGFSASIVRAGLVSILSLWAWYYGRRIKPVVLISFAAALTAMVNPFYLWGDLGWYLSFLAFFGVLVIGPIIFGRFFKKEPRLLTSVLIETLSAEVMALPLILMTFSQLSIVALAANVLVVPWVPLAMLLTAIAGGAGMIAPQLAGWLALPARLLLTYILDLVHLLSDVPSALVHRSISLAYMLGIYALVTGCCLMLLHRTKRLAKEGEEATQ